METENIVDRKKNSYKKGFKKRVWVSCQHGEREIKI